MSLFPREGLILDVRGNGGGYVYIAESLLQYLTPRRIQPEPTQLINTPVTAELCAKAKDLNAWSDSINASIETGAQYSSAIPLYGENSDDAVNQTGQLYHGPVVLVTDALCYSATDTFAAGFQDHEIGKVLGVDDNTGAGGANVWEFKDILADWPDGPFKPLPAGAQFRVALRRTLRIGKRWGGQAVEDLGVLSDVRYRMTRRDLLEGNADLMEKAGELLAAGTPRTLDVTVTSRDRSAVELAVTTAGLTSLDVYVDGRPVTIGGAAIHDDAMPSRSPLAEQNRAPSAWLGHPCSKNQAGLVAAGDPFLQVGGFGADGGVWAVAGMDDRGRIEDEQPVADRVDDRAEVGEGAPGRARSAGEQRVAAEQPALVGQVEAHGAA